MIGEIYMLRGRAVKVLVKWRHVAVPKGVKGPPRNVLIEYLDTGKRDVRPFRGLRKRNELRQLYSLRRIAPQASA